LVHELSCLQIDSLHQKLGKLERMVASLGTPGRDTEAFRKGLLKPVYLVLLCLYVYMCTQTSMFAELAANHETITVAQKSIMQAK
jgi:hypothetical protein